MNSATLCGDARNLSRLEFDHNYLWDGIVFSICFAFCILMDIHICFSVCVLIQIQIQMKRGRNFGVSASRGVMKTLQFSLEHFV